MLKDIIKKNGDLRSKHLKGGWQFLSVKFPNGLLLEDDLTERSRERNG